MRIYAFSGLGADERVFKYLSLNSELIAIKWIPPLSNESIESYAKRLSEVIDTTTPFCILGVSFGGIIAVEVSKLLNPVLTILISTIQTKQEIPVCFRIVAKLNVLRVVPETIIIPPTWFAAISACVKSMVLLGNLFAI